MYQYASKFLPNQINLIATQLRCGSKILTRDKDVQWPFFQGNHVKSSLPLNMVSAENYTPILRTAFITNRRYFTMSRKSKPNILARYYKLTAGRNSLGRISKNSLTQNREYASLLKKITGFFRAKPTAPVKTKRSQNCKNVKACARKSNKKVCVNPAAPPPSVIDFQTATKCKSEIINEEMKYMEAICPQKVEVGHKEKPPFASDGGPFLEDRLCREMPEKRCQKLLEEYALKEEKLQEMAEICASPASKSATDEVKTTVKNSKKEKCKPLSEICPKVPDCKKESANPLKETVCIPVSDNELRINKCRHVKACKAKRMKSKECDGSNLHVCQTLPDCSTINKDMDIELRSCSAVETIKCPIKDDICRNVTPCPKKVAKPPRKKDHCSNSKACPKLKPNKSKCGLIVRPCGSAYKRLKASENVSKLKDCPKDECSARGKFKSATTSNVACQTEKEKVGCQQQSKCATSSCKPAKKRRSCSEEKEPINDAKKAVVCKKQQRMVTCSELKDKSKNTSIDDKSPKKCKPVKKDDDKCTKPPKTDGCPSAKGGPSVRCYSKSNSDPTKFYSKHNIDQFLWQDQVPTKTTKPLEEIIIKPNKYTTSKSTISLQPRELRAYSKISMKLNETGVVSMKMDVANDTADIALSLGNINRKRILHPTINSGRSLQVRDSKSYAISSPNLLRLYGLKCSVSHKSGKIPELPRTARFCASNPNLTARVNPKIFGAAFHNYVTDMYTEKQDDRFSICGKRNASSGHTPPEKTEKKKDETQCQPAKKTCRPRPCCKKEKDKCEMPSEQLKKELRSCSLPKPEPVKTEEQKVTKSPCNFDQAVKAEAKHKAKELCPPPKYMQIDVCPPKKQLCCYQKKNTCKKPTPKDSECVMCKKYQILDLPSKIQPKPTVCKIVKCGARKPCPLGTKTPLALCQPKGIEKRGEMCPKCDKPKFKVTEEKPKKRSGNISSRCSEMSCLQKKCTKKIPKPPCPEPIKSPTPKNLMKKDPCPKVCVKKPKPVTDEAAKKSLAKKCAKPPSKKTSKARLVCDNPAVAKAISRKIETEKLEKEAQEKIYAEMKHTEWRAVAVKGDNRWCKTPSVEKVAESTTNLSKTVLPTTEEKYQSPRYKKNDKKAPCSFSKKCPKAKNKHVRKLHSCPHLGQVWKAYNVKSTNSANIQRDYFDNMANLIPVKETIVDAVGEQLETNEK